MCTSTPPTNKNNFHRSSFARSLSSIHHRDVVSIPASAEETSVTSKKRERRSTIICQMNDDSITSLPFTKDGSYTETAICKSSSNTKKHQKRPRARVTFEMDNDFDDESLVVEGFEPEHGTSSSQSQQVKSSSRSVIRKDYALGDTARSSEHITLNLNMNHRSSSSSSSAVSDEVESLQKHDFAFIKRSDGSFTYAILAGRDIRNKKNCKRATEECMTFVMNRAGATKMIRKCHWSEYVYAL